MSRYKSHNTKDRLAELDNKKLMTLVTDKDQRKSVVNALKGIASGEVGFPHEQRELKHGH